LHTEIAALPPVSFAKFARRQTVGLFNQYSALIKFIEQFKAVERKD